jgi:hypothetical protein
MALLKFPKLGVWGEMRDEMGQQGTDWGERGVVGGGMGRGSGTGDEEGGGLGGLAMAAPSGRLL